MKYVLLLETAISHLKVLFPDSSKDSITREEMFANAGRDINTQDSKEKTKNKYWFKNQMMYLRQHNLVIAKYAKRRGKAKVVGLELTNQGKIALGRMEGELKTTPAIQENKPQLKPESKTSDNKALNLEETLRAMKNIKEDGEQLIVNINEGTISIK